MGPLGWQETVFIFLLALLIFGPKKLPELGKNIAKGLTEFRRASSDLKATFDREMSNLERETESLKEVTQTYHNEISSYDSNYESSYYDEYGNTNHDSSSDSSATDSSTVGASATQGAESPANTVPAAPPDAAATELADVAPAGANGETATLTADSDTSPADATAETRTAS